MRRPQVTGGDLGIKRRFKTKILWVAGRRGCDRRSPVVNRGLIDCGLVGLIGDWSPVTWGRPCLNHGLIGLITDGSQIQPAATCGDLRSPDADNKIWLLIVEVVGWYQTCLIFATTTTATSRVSKICLKIALRSPGSMPKYGGRSLVVACGNLVLVCTLPKFLQLFTSSDLFQYLTNRNRLS